MKIKYILYALLCCILLNACSKELDVESPNDLSISIDPSLIKDGVVNLKVGDTAKFLMSGNAENITFYSGEVGRNYLYADRKLALGATQLAFTSNATNGTQANTLQVLATTSLAKLDSTNVVGANWTDITSRAVLSTGAGAKASGTIDLSDLVKNPSDSLTFAFKYTGTTGSAQRTWTITALTVNNVLTDGTIIPQLTLATDVTYWSRYRIGTSVNWATPSTTQLQVVGGGATAANNTSWIVSRPVFVGRVNPDPATVVKHLGSEIPKYTIAGKTYSGYNYVYTKAGTYTATITAFNITTGDRKEVVKQFTIKVQ